MGYSVLGAALQTAATVARATGETAAAVDLAATASGIGTALPGTVVVPAAAKLATAWETAIKSWRGGIAKHGDHLQDSADVYDAADAAAATELRRAGGGR
ncbi:MAG: hypothetical protein ACRDTF_10540 [Pseudonocardiaceae bacterium]